MKKLTIFLILAYFPSTYALTPYQLESETLGKRQFQLQLAGELFSSSAKYNEDGAETDFGAGEGFKRLQGGVKTTFGLSESFDLFGGLNGRYNHSKTTAYDLENSGIESYFLGFKYYLGKVPDFGGYDLKAAITFEARNTAYNSNSYPAGTAPTDVIILGDDGYQVKAGIDFSLTNKEHSIFALSTYYVVPPNNLSHEINYSFEIAQRFHYSAVKLGLRGIISIKNDDYTDNPADKPDMSVGATNVYNSINRSLTMPYVGLNYAFSRVRLEFEAGMIVSGTSTDQGHQLKTTFCWQI